jgi:hypothetical protein
MTSQWDEKRFRGVVANPSSYAYYITPLRFYDDRWNLPPKEDCPGYIQWKWGLHEGGNLTVPYVHGVLHELGISFLIRRFARRHLIYLIGSLDHCNVSRRDPGWCCSPGLETSCMDNLPGPNRLERHLRYVLSLRNLGIPCRRMLVLGVGHDHSLMFNSDNGLRSIYGKWKTTPHLARET